MLAMVFLLVICLTIQSMTGQSNETCKWGNFDLQGTRGYEVQCVDGEWAYGYTPCMQYALCNGMRYQATFFNRNTGQCQYYLAEWDDGATIPQYIYHSELTQWTFNYENGEITEQCPNGIEFEINWICDEQCTPFCMDTTCGQDQINKCKHTMSIKSIYACTAPPPNNDCIWAPFNLQGVRGYEIQCIDNPYIYAYTPCMAYSLCNGIRYQATLWNRDVLQCQYYLSQWDNGDVSPIYFNDGGNPLWQFNYRNGEETMQCTQGVEFEINWICDQQCTPYCLDSVCNQVNECRHQMSIKSIFACITPEKSQNKTGISKLLGLQKQLGLDTKK